MEPCKYLSYASAVPGRCSATESTNGFPVCVCLINKPRTRTDNGPNHPVGASAAQIADAIVAAPVYTLILNCHAFFLSPCNFCFLINISPYPMTFKPKKTNMGPICSALLIGCNPTTGN